MNITSILLYTLAAIVGAYLLIVFILAGLMFAKKHIFDRLWPGPYSVVKIYSPSFQNYGPIPYEYERRWAWPQPGGGVNPELRFENIPLGTQSLVLIMEDQGIPSFFSRFDVLHLGKRTVIFDNWVVYDIPPTSTGIAEDSIPHGKQGKNSLGENKYAGPLVSREDGTHDYIFTIYALSAMLNLPEGATKLEVLDAAKKHIIGKGEYRGVSSWVGVL